MFKFSFFSFTKKWNKIIDNAFASDDVHVFSDNYIQRRTLLQNTTLNRNKKLRNIMPNLRSWNKLT